MNPKTTLCTHITKLSKKSIQSLTSLFFPSTCFTCSISLNPTNSPIGTHPLDVLICLHCGGLFHDLKCVLQHDENHMFCGHVQVCEGMQSLLDKNQEKERGKVNGVFCRICGDLDGNKNEGDEEQKKKLGRFKQFVQTFLISTIKPIIAFQFDQSSQYQQQPPAVGLINLGNTCYLNSVLQSLICTSQLCSLYTNFSKTKSQNTLISQERGRRRQIQQFYQQEISKSEQQSWHVVRDKKSKNVKNQYGNGFLVSGLVKNDSFNFKFQNMLRDIRQSQLLLSQSFNGKPCTYQPIQILTQLGEFDKKYQFKQEQDAEEMLIFMIDLLSQGQLVSMTASQDKKDKYRKIEELLGRQKLTFSQQLFGSYLASHIVCLGCKKENWTLDFTYHYPLPLESSNKIQSSMGTGPCTPVQNIKYFEKLFYPKVKQSSANILFSLFKPERLTNRDNYYTCEKCLGLSAVKQFYVVDPPQILVLSLKRFEFHRKFKITKIVNFEQSISLENYILISEQQQEESQKQPKKFLYDLYSVIVHKGDSISSGHYISYCKKENQGSEGSHWYQFSDDKIRKVPTKQVLRQQAYILFYRRTKDKDNK